MKKNITPNKIDLNKFMESAKIIAETCTRFLMRVLITAQTNTVINARFHKQAVAYLRTSGTFYRVSC